MHRRPDGPSVVVRVLAIVLLQVLIMLVFLGWFFLLLGDDMNLLFN